MLCGLFLILNTSSSLDSLHLRLSSLSLYLSLVKPLICSRCGFLWLTKCMPTFSKRRRTRHFRHWIQKISCDHVDHTQPLHITAATLGACERGPRALQTLGRKLDLKKALETFSKSSSRQRAQQSHASGTQGYNVAVSSGSLQNSPHLLSTLALGPWPRSLHVNPHPLCLSPSCSGTLWPTGARNAHSNPCQARQRRLSVHHASTRASCQSSRRWMLTAGEWCRWRSCQC